MIFFSDTKSYSKQPKVRVCNIRMAGDTTNLETGRGERYSMGRGKIL